MGRGGEKNNTYFTFLKLYKIKVEGGVGWIISKHRGMSTEIMYAGHRQRSFICENNKIKAIRLCTVLIFLVVILKIWAFFMYFKLV